MPEFSFTELLPTGPDDTPYRRLDVAVLAGATVAGLTAASLLLPRLAR